MSWKYLTLWVQLFPGCKWPVLLCCVYRPPSQMAFYDDLLQECENSLVGKAQKLFIVSDFNSNFLQHTLPQTHMLVAMKKYLNLHELVGQPTRVTESSHSLMLTNVPDDLCDPGVVPCSCTDSSPYSESLLYQGYI